MTPEGRKSYEELKDDYKQKAQNHLSHMGNVIVNGMEVVVERNDWFLCGSRKLQPLPEGSFPLGLGYGAFVVDGHEFVAGEVYIFQRVMKYWCVYELKRDYINHL